LSSKFESAVGVELNDGVIKARWEDAVKRYWVMKSMDELCCGSMVKKEKEGCLLLSSMDMGAKKGMACSGRT